MSNLGHTAQPIAQLHPTSICLFRVSSFIAMGLLSPCQQTSHKGKKSIWLLWLLTPSPFNTIALAYFVRTTPRSLHFGLAISRTVFVSFVYRPSQIPCSYVGICSRPPDPRCDSTIQIAHFVSVNTLNPNKTHILLAGVNHAVPHTILSFGPSPF
jgi:hypothetical protein